MLTGDVSIGSFQVVVVKETGNVAVLGILGLNYVTAKFERTLARAKDVCSQRQDCNR